MPSRSRLLVLCVLALSFPGAAAAQLVADGLYAGGSFGIQFENFSGSGSFDFDEALGGSARLGSRLHPLVSVEVQYEYTGEFEDEALGATVEIEQHVITANGRLFPIPGRFEPFLMAGMGYARAELDARGTLRADDTGDGFVIRVGTGVQIGLLESLSLAIEGGFVLPSGDLSDLSYFTVSGGLNVHFRGL